MILLAGVFLSPFRTLRLPNINFTLSDGLLVLAGLGLCIGSSRLKLTPMVSRTATMLWVAGGFLFFTGFIVSAISSDYGQGGVDLLLQYAFAYFFVPILLASMPAGRLGSAIAAYVAGMAVVSAVALLAYYVFPSWALAFGNNGDRMGSFLSNPNALANTVALTLPLCMYLMGRRGGSSLLAWGALFLLIGGLLVASSFGGLLVALLGAIVSLAVSARVRQWPQRLLVGIAVPAIYFAVFGFPASFVERVLPALTSKELSAAGSFDERRALAEQALAMIETSPIIGSGGNTFIERTGGEMRAHNTLLLIWVEGGAIALVGWLSMLGSLLLPALGSARVTARKYLAGPSLGVLAVFGASMLTQNHAYGRHVAIPVYLAVLLAAYGVQRRSLSPAV